MIAIKIINAIANCFYIYGLLIFVRCILTWFPINWDSPIFFALRSATDIYLDLFRKIIPPLGMIDISPMVAFFVLIIIRNVILYGTVFVMSMMGILN